MFPIMPPRGGVLRPLLFFLLSLPVAALCAQSAYLQPVARSGDLLPRDNREPFYPTAVVHTDSAGFLVQYHNRAGCRGDLDCYHYQLVQVAPDLGASRRLAPDLGARDPSSFLTINQLGGRINVYFRDLNPLTGRREYAARSYAATDLRAAGREKPVGSILVSKHGRAAGANFRTNDRTGRLATLLQDKSERSDAYAPVRVTLYDSLHQVVWERGIAAVGGNPKLRITDATVRDDDQVAALVEFGDSNDRYLLLIGPGGVTERRIEVPGASAVLPMLEYAQGNVPDLFVFGKYYTEGAGVPAGLFLLKYDPAELSDVRTTLVPLSQDATQQGLRRSAGAVDVPAPTLPYFNHVRFLPTPDGGGYLVGNTYDSEWKVTPQQSYRRERYGAISVLRFTPGGECGWVRNLYRAIDWPQGLTIRERFGAHLVGNDLVVLFNYDGHGDPVTGDGLRTLTFLPDMAAAIFRLSPENEVRRRDLLPFDAEKSILVPPVSVLSADGNVLHAAIEKPMGFRKIYTYTLDW
ncbi:hypothetical protein [Lewinella sp. IMCC34183]|uniref:hypothetical protein n=1 Tax=Lewinella sp. IMCC34183 TaxID=2248762 RepID=UPI000E23E274|nr:hypothetical protein [Lewinella sp. IMCC34183]